MPDQERKIEALLGSYPRVRPELTPGHRASYVEHYRANRSGSSWLSRQVAGLESWMHRQVADCQAARVLEIGAGTLNHVPYHSEAAVYDAVEPFRELWVDSPHRGRIGHLYEDLADVPSGQHYDAIVSVAVLEHLTDLPAMLARSGELLAPDGRFRAGFPSEGGLLWGLAWRMTTGLKYRWDRGLDYGVIMRHEHVNTADEIIAMLEYFYGKVSLDRFPTRWRHASFYTAASAEAPRLDRCARFLATRGSRVRV